MSHGQETYSSEDIKKIVEAPPLYASKLLHRILYLLIFLGVASFFSEFIASDEGKKHVWVSMHVNFLYWFGAAAASSGFAATFHICNAQWVRPLRRIFESAYPFLMISPLFFLFLHFGAPYIYLWAQVPIAGKEKWLTVPFLYSRDFIAVLLLAWIIGQVVVKGTLTLDFTAIRGGLVKIGKESPAYSRWFGMNADRYIAKGASPEKAIRNTYNRMGRFSPVCIMVYALSMSLLAFDLLMSVDPHWYSTMFGGFYFMSSVYLAVAFVTVGVGYVLGNSELFQQAIKKKTLHDLGKLLFGFGIFWAYLFWSHYLPIWYGNMPEETGFIILRLREYPWRNIAWIVLGMCFVIPFILGISRDVKQIPSLLALTGIIAAVGLWLQYYLLFAPTLYPNVISINIIDVGIGLGFLGFYSLLALKYLASVPLIPFGDLLMSEEE
jgi:hypothetical protein